MVEMSKEGYVSTLGPRPGRCWVGQWMLQAHTAQPSRLRAVIWTLFHWPSLPGDARGPSRQIFSLVGISTHLSPNELEPDTTSFGPGREGGGEETEHTHRPMCAHQTHAHICTHVAMYAHLHKRDTCVQPTHTRHMCTCNSHSLTNTCT